MASASFLTANQIRESFLKYFESKDHFRERPSPLIPQNDPTLLFTNAGMVQFKDAFTGLEKRSYVRATTCQKCVRAGGKHNDLESVGFTRRHHTFFEMLGNFSFGNYFKKEAIEFAWEYLTEFIKLPKERLWVSVFETDDEAAELWAAIAKLPKERIVRMGEKDNFWAMGDAGPCGPCSEIYYDRGEAFGKNETIFDGGERFLEIWNLVFMQFERHADGKMTPLPKPSVDTGMGLERLASVVQNVESNYLVDSMRTILDGFAKNIGKVYGQNEADDVALRVLTDHIRSVGFLIADGVQPSNEGRGYVLRRILRRAIRYGKKLGCSRPFFFEGVELVDQVMGDFYPEIRQGKSAIKKMIQMEEERFFETLELGLKLLESKIVGLRKGQALDGAIAFQLYDTFGFPLDLTEVILSEHGLRLDHEGFNKHLEDQRERSRASWKGSGQAAVSELYKTLALDGLKSSFVGYGALEVETQVIKIIKNHSEICTKVAAGDLREDDDLRIVIRENPFYAESGGQASDTGELLGSKTKLKAAVVDVSKPVSEFTTLKVKLLEGSLSLHDVVVARVNQEQRLKTRINHSITHVLHATLREVLGDHVKQAGSLVCADYLRFDFSHYRAVSRGELREIEALINRRIIKNDPVETHEQSLDEAIKGGAIAFFEEKYGDRVRVLSIGGFSKELCGGTHAERLGEAGLFKITSESSVAAGVRRIVAVTGEAAYRYALEQEDQLEKIASLLKVGEKDILGRVEKILKDQKDLEQKLKSRAAQPSTEVSKLVESIEGIEAVVRVVETDDAKDLRGLSDQYKQKIKRGVVVLGAKSNDRATVVISVSDEIAELFNTKALADLIANSLGGKGGGKPTFSQVGGPNVEALKTEQLRAHVIAHVKALQLTA